MKNKNLFVLLLLLAIGLVAFGSTFLYVKLNNEDAHDEDFVIMTSCNPMYIACMNIADGIDGVVVENLSQPTTGCLHDYTLTAEDMKNLSHADVLVVNGGGMEGYLDDVIEAYPGLTIIDSMDGDILFEGDSNAYFEALEELREENSHAWLSYTSFESQIDAIYQGLASIDPNHKDEYLENTDRYLNTLYDELYSAITDLRSDLEGQPVVILHEAYEYIACDLGMEVVGIMDLDEERQVSAGEVSDLIDTIVENDVKIVFAEEDYGSDMGALIEEQTDAKVIYLETLIHGTYEADSYEKIMSENYELIGKMMEIYN